MKTNNPSPLKQTGKNSNKINYNFIDFFGKIKLHKKNEFQNVNVRSPYWTHVYY
jgi:hypothetical protein